MCEVGDFPMIGESTLTNPSHHSESSREGITEQVESVASNLNIENVEMSEEMD